MKIKLNYILLGLVSILSLFSCKKYANPDPVYETLIKNVDRQRKVLVISIDGLSGAELQAVAPSNITALQKNAKYSYNTLATPSDAAGWVSMTTGTSFAKHRVLADNFDREVSPGEDEHTAVKSYRNVFDYVTQYKATKTALVTPWENLRNYLKNTNFAPVVTTDLAVKDSTISILTSQPALGTIFVNFRDVETAGGNGGYTAANGTYKDAIIKADEYVGNILTALKSRKNYDGEDWLIILTSNHGGSNAKPTNGFTLLYNPAFQPFELKKSGFNSILFNNASMEATIPDDHDLYNMGANQDFTVQMQVKFVNVTSFQAFLSKSTANLSSSFTGWMWYQSTAGNMTMSAGGTDNGGPAGRINMGSIGVVADNTWHTVTMTIKRTNATTRTMTAYVDGVVKGTPVNVHDRLSLSTTEPLKIGRRSVDNSTSFSTFNAANLLYFNTALDQPTINANKDLKDITKHPNYTNLIGFWPMDEGGEGFYYNNAPSGYNMEMHGTYQWASLGANYPAGSTPDANLSSLSVTTTMSDISALTLYWMKINILSDFSFDGQPYLKNFELEFLK